MKRIQRKRTKGWKMPEGAIYVGRPTIYGNPYKVGPDMTREQTVEAFREKMKWRLDGHSHFMTEVWKIRLEKLRGHDLACWCKEGEPCHADVLIELVEALK